MAAFLLLTTLIAPARAADLDVSRILKGIEDRYNHAQALQLSFTESYQLRGRQHVEKGELFLRKPGRMRWQYTSPPGKLFISDNKFIYSYTPQDHHAEKMKMKEADAPLAFCSVASSSQDFREFRAARRRRRLHYGHPKSDSCPTRVSFLAARFLHSPPEVKG